MTHEQIIKGSQRGERNCQELFFKMYYPKLIGVAIKIAPNKDVGEDNLQETFIRGFERINLLSRTNKPIVYSWLKRILLNITIDYYRNGNYRLTNSLEDMTHIVDVDEGYDEITYLERKDIKLEKIHDAISSLSPQYKIIFNLYVVDGYIHSEISDKLGITVNTSKANLSKAKTILRKKLEVCPAQ